jgi:Uma2 family endonuclease
MLADGKGMTSLQLQSESSLMKVDLSALMTLPEMSEEQFYEFCRRNADLRIERSAQGEVIVMPPTFADTGNRNNKLSYQVTRWAEENENGEVFDSSAGFTLPNGATRSPDVSWIQFDRWNALTAKQQASYAPICPDFVIELRSDSDSLKGLQEKMREYIENGAVLGLLVDRKNKNVYCYRTDGSVGLLHNPPVVSCEPELSGLILQMAKIW